MAVWCSLSSWAQAQESAPPPPPPPPPPTMPPADEPAPAQPAPAPPPPAQAPAATYPPPAAPPPASAPPPPAGYPQPYPPQYPQPYPPYPPPYAPPPPQPPPPPPGPRYPDEASTMASPFFDALLVGGVVDERFSDGLMLGGQVGGYIAHRLRLTARFIVPTDPTSESSQSRLIGYSFDDEVPDFLFGATVGVVVSQRSSFVFSPGLMLHRTNLADHGTIFGANLPFEWVLRGGVRFGLDASIGRALGGQVRGECVDTTVMFCAPGEERQEDRESGVAFMIGFQVGFGLGYPDPLPAGEAKQAK